MTKTPQTDMTLANLTEVTNDPIDAMRLASDLYAMSAYRAELGLAPRADFKPRAPRPRSTYLRTFTKELRAKMNVIIRTLDATELGRLMKLGPAISLWMESANAELSDEIFRLVAMTPDEAVVWIREHLDEIEARFAS